MLKSKCYQSFALIFISVLFFACSGATDKTSSDPETSVKTVNQTESVGSETASGDQSDKVSGICANKYYPIDAAKQRKYVDAKNSSTNYVLTQIKNDDDTFIEKRDFGAGTETINNWLCTDEGLRNAEFNNGANFSQGNFRMETLESSGVSIPKEWEVGKKWTTAYKISAKLKAGAASGSANGTVKIDNEIVSLDDKIKTPAGEFEAAKVVSNINMNLNVGKPVNMKMTNWYAPNVGIVKQELDSPFGSGMTTEYAGEK